MRRINRHFFYYITTGKPYIVDGRRRAGESDSEYAVRRRELYATYAAVLAGTESDVPDESFAHFNGPVQAVGADEVVIGGHRPLLLEAGALACTYPDEWLSELASAKSTASSWKATKHSSGCPWLAKKTEAPFVRCWPCISLIDGGFVCLSSAISLIGGG